MNLSRILSTTLLAVLLTACGAVVDQPYSSCTPGDACGQGTVCAATTLPASSGFTGSFCTNGCNVGSDCLMDLTNYATSCVNSQCYITCPAGGGSCPYGTGCLTFMDQNGNPINLCTP
jgi:hypothetical protein